MIDSVNNKSLFQALWVNAGGTPGSSPGQTEDSGPPNKRGRSADGDEQSSPPRAKKPKPAGMLHLIFRHRCVHDDNDELSPQII